MEHHKFFDDKSDIYRNSRPTYNKALLEFVSSLPKDRELAWDCATGNGQAAVGLAHYFSKVIATDVSPSQIAHAISSDKVEYFVQEVETPTLLDASVDLISVAQALHWFDYDKYWPVVDRVLKTGGAFAAWGYDWFSISAAIDKVIQVSVLDDIFSYWAPQNQILWGGYKTVNFPYQKIETPKLTLSMQWNLDQLFSYIHSWSATRRCMEQRGEQFLVDARKCVANVWGDAHTLRSVVMPLHILAGRKQ